MKKVILFDLDGTLLPMDLEIFIKAYFSGLAQKLAPFGVDPDKLIAGIMAGTKGMVKNDGTKTNEQVFWDTFVNAYGEDVLKHKPQFDDFYRNEFQLLQKVCGFNPAAAEAVHKIKGAGYRVALATNPIFPSYATESRTRWAGLNTDEFALYTTYENSCFCKPNPAYYQAVVDALGVDPKECLMVGNDGVEDVVASTLGMQVFLITDCLINKKGADLSAYPQGSFADLQTYLGLV